MNKDISSNIEYFEENTTKNDNENDELIEKIKKYIKIYLGITTVIFIIVLIGNSYDNSINGYPKSTFKIITQSVYYSYLVPIAIILLIFAWFFSTTTNTSIAGVTVPSSSSIGISDFVDKKTSNKEKMTNMDTPNISAINTSTTISPTISQSSQINNNQSNIIPQKSLIDIPKKSISNMISPATKENISSFKSDVKSLLSKTEDTVNSSNKVSKKPQVAVKNVSSNKPPVSVKNVSSNKLQVAVKNVSSNKPSVSVKNMSSNKPPVSVKNVSSNKPTVAVKNVSSINIKPMVKNVSVSGGGNDDDILNNIIMVGGIGILSYILYMLYNEIVMLNKIKKDIDEKNKRHNKLILTSNNIL